MRSRRAAVLIAACAAAVGAACTSGTGGADSPAADGTPSGFGRVGATVTAPDGTVCSLCLWAATDNDLRGRGLMGVTSLGGLDGMAFVYDEPVNNRFHMTGTVMPLSIAFVDEGGVVVSVDDMQPCASDDVVACPRYTAAAPYALAVEVPQGQLDRLGLVAGARVELTDDCGIDPLSPR